ncbi:MAG: fibronectin type III domain-containing protein, partial [Candidatus Magasanikbacteria bacterium]|nr:fibronectin type III domain-containing protein [Candidatus Magasanikbacteria bacterium]
MMEKTKKISLFLITAAIMMGWPFAVAYAAASFVSCGTAVAVNKNNMAAVGIPVGIQNNDILITYVHTRDNIDSTMPVDWTNNVAGNDGATNRLEIFWKRTTGAESAPTVTHSGGDSSIARMCAFRGIDTAGDPFNVVGAVQSNAGSPISTAAITTTVDGAMILHIFGSQDDNAWGSYTGTPTNEAGQDMNTLGTDDSLVLTYGLQAVVGSTDLAGATQTARGPDAGASVQMALRPLPITTIGNGANPSSVSIAPGASATDLDSFTLRTSFGSDTITAAEASLSAGSSGGLSLVAITSDNGSVTYCSQANPASDTVSLSSCNISVTNSSTQFKVRVTPKSHTNMPASPGSTYAVTGTVTSFTGTNAQSGTDTGSATVTIDNQSPANVTSTSGTAGNTQVSLNWTNPADSDFHSVVVLRRASTAVTDTPTEGITYIVGNTIGSSIVACVSASPATNCVDTGLSNGTAYHYKIFSKDTNLNYSTGVVPTGSPFTPVVPADTTTPAAVNDLAASNPGQTSVHLTWTAPGDDGSIGTANTYDVRYSTSNITEGDWSSATQASGEPTPSIAGTGESMTATGLSANTTYYFAMKTSDEVLNTSSLSNVPSATTLIGADITAPAAVTDLTASNPTTSSLDLSWTAPGDDNNSGTATTYDIRYFTSSITNASWNSAAQVSGEPAPQVTGTGQSMTATGLSANTTYYFAMKTSDEAPNESVISNVASGATLAEAVIPS